MSTTCYQTRARVLRSGLATQNSTSASSNRITNDIGSQIPRESSPDAAPTSPARSLADTPEKTPRRWPPDLPRRYLPAGKERFGVFLLKPKCRAQRLRSVSQLPLASPSGTMSSFLIVNLTCQNYSRGQAKPTNRLSHRKLDEIARFFQNLLTLPIFFFTFSHFQPGSPVTAAILS